MMRSDQANTLIDAVGWLLVILAGIGGFAAVLGWYLR
jgi:hypothetical protein